MRRPKIPKSNNEIAKADILVYVALSEEFRDAVRLFGDDIEPKEYSDIAITCFFSKIFAPALDTSYVLAIVPAGKMGNTRSATITSALLSKLEPNDVVVIGIAGSVSDDLKPGDVFLPDSVDEYLANSASSGRKRRWTFQTSGNHFQTSLRLMNRFQLFSTTDPTSFDAWGRITREHFDTLFDESARATLEDAGLEILPQGNLLVGDDRKLASGPAVGKGNLITHDPQPI
jgi:nucleoside phosphorylase